MNLEKYKKVFIQGYNKYSYYVRGYKNLRRLYFILKDKGVLGNKDTFDLGIVFKDFDSLLNQKFSVKIDKNNHVYLVSEDLETVYRADKPIYLNKTLKLQFIGPRPFYEFKIDDNEFLKDILEFDNIIRLNGKLLSLTNYEFFIKSLIYLKNLWVLKKWNKFIEVVNSVPEEYYEEDISGPMRSDISFIESLLLEPFDGVVLGTAFKELLWYSIFYLYLIENNPLPIDLDKVREFVKSIYDSYENYNVKDYEFDNIINNRLIDLKLLEDILKGKVIREILHWCKESPETVSLFCGGIDILSYGRNIKEGLAIWS